MKKFDFVSPYECLHNTVYDAARKGARRGYTDCCLIGIGVSAALTVAMIGYGAWVEHRDAMPSSHDYDWDTK
nr:MAG TPA: Protein melan-A [Caudoviricetes sp.]